MKKFSGLILSFVCILTIILTGCTYADNATLLSIKEKYNYITTNNEEIFYGSELHLTYNSEDLLFLINSDNENYNILKTNSSISDYTTSGGYGLLMHCVNSTNLSNNALSIISNNAITDKKYKVGMYNALASLQENVKKLYNDKISFVPRLNFSFSKTPIGPLIIIVFAFLIYFLKSFIVLWPISNAI